MILSDCGRAAARSRQVHRDVPCADGCALLLSHVNQINMTREKTVSWFIYYRRSDGRGSYLSFDGKIGRSPSSAVVTHNGTPV